MGGIKKILDWSEKFAIWGSVVTFIVMIIMGIMQVFCRYVFDSSLTFTEELARYTFVWTVFLASAVCLRRQNHAAIELFVNWMPEKTRKIVLLISSLCCIIFFALVMLKGAELTVATWQQPSPSLQISMGLIYLAIPVGAFLMLAYAIEGICTQFNPKLSQDRTESEVLE